MAIKDKFGYDILGHYDSVSRVLQVDNGYVNGLSVVNNQFRYQAIGLMLTITTLHEFVHYGRDINNLPILIKDLSGKKEREAGWCFERSIDYNNIYPRRTSLSNSDGSDNFSSLNETTPLYNYLNGVITVNLDAFNCHYHTFGLQYATKVDEEHPKWVIAIGLKASEWQQVTGSAQIGDKVLYYKNYNNKSAFVHSAVVTEVDADGYATKVSSKMGPYEIITHHPRDIPVSYGSPNPTFFADSKTLPSRIYWRKK